MPYTGIFSGRVDLQLVYLASRTMNNVFACAAPALSSEVVFDFVCRAPMLVIFCFRDGVADYCSVLSRCLCYVVAHSTPTRASCRRLYDCLVSLLNEKGAKFSDIRRVIERGMKTGAVSLMKDVRGNVVES